MSRSVLATTQLVYCPCPGAIPRSFQHQPSLSGCLLALSSGGYYVIYQGVTDGSDGHTHRTRNERGGGDSSISSFVQMTGDLSDADFGTAPVFLDKTQSSKVCQRGSLS